MTVQPHAEPFHFAGNPDTPQGKIGVLLSHGFTGSPASMVPWGKYLAERGYTVAVPRLREIQAILALHRIPPRKVA